MNLTPCICLRYAFLLSLTALLALLLQACDSRPSGPIRIACGSASNFQCPRWMFCELIEGCGGVERAGFCRPRPEECPSTQEYVCGCDGNTYTNRCIAAVRGITVARMGGCKEEPKKP